MKFGCCFSIFAFILFFLPFSAAVHSTNCHKHEPTYLPGFEETFSVAQLTRYFEAVDLSTRLSQETSHNPYGQCQGYYGCVIYVCTNDDGNVIISGGCPKDMIDECQYFADKRDYYDRHRPNVFELDSYIDDTKKNLVYSYGCKGYGTDERQCIEKRFLKYIHVTPKSEPVTTSEPERPKRDSFDEMRNRPMDTNKLERTNVFRKDRRRTSGAYQNGYTMKFIGIFIFGWIFTAAWIC